MDLLRLESVSELPKQEGLMGYSLFFFSIIKWNIIYKNNESLCFIPSPHNIVSQLYFNKKREKEIEIIKNIKTNK